MLNSYFKQGNLEYFEIRDGYSYFLVSYKGNTRIESEFYYFLDRMREHYETNKETIEQMKLSMESDPSTLDRLNVVKERLEHLRNTDLATHLFFYPC